MLVERHVLTLSATTGDVAAQFIGPLNARILSLHLQYNSATAGGFATTAAISVLAEATQQTIWSESLTTLATTTVNLHRAPRQVLHTSAGVALTATECLIREPINVGNGRLQVTATSVGSGSRTATLQILTG